MLFHLMVTCVLSDLSVHMKTSVDPEGSMHGHVSIIMGVTRVKYQKPSLAVVTVSTASVSAAGLFQYSASL